MCSVVVGGQQFNRERERGRAGKHFGIISRCSMLLLLLTITLRNWEPADIHTRQVMCRPRTGKRSILLAGRESIRMRMKGGGQGVWWWGLCCHLLHDWPWVIKQFWKKIQEPGANLALKEWREEDSIDCWARSWIEFLLFSFLFSPAPSSAPDRADTVVNRIGSSSNNCTSLQVMWFDDVVMNEWWFPAATAIRLEKAKPWQVLGAASRRRRRLLRSSKYMRCNMSCRIVSPQYLSADGYLGSETM